MAELQQETQRRAADAEAAAEQLRQLQQEVAAQQSAAQQAQQRVQEVEPQAPPLKRRHSLEAAIVDSEELA